MTKPNANKELKLSNNLGIDIDKRKLDYSFGQGLHHGSEPNDAEGHARLIALCRLRPGVRVICEATGGYEKKLVKALRKEGIEVHVVMPLKVKYLAIAAGQMSKTDPIDAGKLALYGEKIELKKHRVASEHDEKLRELVECRKHLVERRVQLAGKRENAGERMLQLLDAEQAEIERLEQQIEKETEECIAANAESREKVERMIQVKGVGRKVAAGVLAYMPELGMISDKTASALAGLAPYADQSGLVEKPRHIRGGRRELRQVLFPAAMVAMRSNPILKTFNQRLKDKGKPGKVRVTAVMRKLICLLNRLCAEVIKGQTKGMEETAKPPRRACPAQ